MALIDFNTRTRPAAAPARSTFSLFTALAVWRSRRALARLDAAQLDDIGLSPKRAAHEAAKPVWDVPATWRR
ncbi:DUF1127 domain-containing protein [uncultured Tateyamaria sp.]|uniref:DUF1127 domain-containing protein n=1 Tax=Tateyamaria sp. 1078 TaxID=3417464 RepID=UPI002621DCD6|nr:DUF1127 domain-containing protein [uncultured Tateyamaria sp.]